MSLAAPIRGLLGPRYKVFTPSTPNNQALNSWRCPHRWHGLDCRTDACPCSSSWVDPS